MVTTTIDDDNHVIFIQLDNHHNYNLAKIKKNWFHNRQNFRF